MKKQSSKSVLIIFSLIMLAAMSSCNSSDSKDGKNKIYTSNGVGVSGTSSGELYGGNLSGFKGRASSGSNASSGLNMPGSVPAPSASISQVDVENVPQRQVASANTYSQSQSKTFKSSNVDNSALQQNAPKSDINSTLKARTTEISTTTSTGTKTKTTPAVSKKGPQKGGPAKPGEPGVGSLPVGDGTWMLLLMMGMYATRKIIKA